MIIGDVLLPDGYAFEDEKLTVESPVLVYDADGEPAELVSELLQSIFIPNNRRLIPLGMSLGDMIEQLSSVPDAVMIETVGGYRVWADISVDLLKVDTSKVGVYYPLTLHFPPGIGFGPEGYRSLETAVYVLDPDEVDLQAILVNHGGVTIGWFKEVSSPELWVSVDGGDWHRVVDNVINLYHFYPASFGGSSYNQLFIYTSRFASGYVYDFEVRYEDDGLSVNILRVDLTGSRPEYYPYEGDRTGGDRYRNPWEIIIGGGSKGDTDTDDDDSNGSSDDGSTPTPGTEPDPTDTGSSNNNPVIAALSHGSGVSNIGTQLPHQPSQPPLQPGILILEPANPIMPADMPTELEFSSDNPVPTASVPRIPLIADVPLINPLAERTDPVSSFPVLLLAFCIIGVAAAGAVLVYIVRRRRVFVA